MGKWTRRALIAAGSLVGGGLLLGVGGLAFAPNRWRIGRERAGAQGLNTWVAVTRDNRVLIQVPHCDIGQGAQSALAMMLADELDADWNSVEVYEAPALPELANGHLLTAFLPLKSLPGPLQRGYLYATYRLTRLGGFQVTGGSASVRATGQFGMRIAGAAAREMLLRAAARRWRVDWRDCNARDSFVTHLPSGRRATFGELAPLAASFAPPTRPRLKTRSELRLVGTTQRRHDIPAKVDGSAIFGADVRVPQMLYAAIRAAPAHGAVLLGCDPAPAQSMLGVHRVVTLPNAVAVVADSWWRAQRAVERLQPRFSEPAPDRRLDSAGLLAQHSAALERLGPNRAVNGAAAGSVPAGAGGPVVRARYELPFLHHATIEPMNATAQLRDGHLTVWTGVQDPLNAAHV
ncbi:MAG: molybdopterin-dependent oxidoreductase, partial [Steroidobacteraceae bacterium]|nr:molybdopterin-dependent oxidoreductase [Steroidobacteraceae bacterium]MDW8259831.1 xanthine dehydrogenase family protein molybdopterin-binding subunit [Gammaproteobacteria bacterium]